MASTTHRYARYHLRLATIATVPIADNGSKTIGMGTRNGWAGSPNSLSMGAGR